MKKKIIQIGDSWGLILPKTILELLKINPVSDKIELDIVNNEIRIKKADKDFD